MEGILFTDQSLEQKTIKSKKLLPDFNKSWQVYCKQFVTPS